MTNIFSVAASSHTVDTAEIQSELDAVAAAFKEDYDMYYAQ